MSLRMLNKAAVCLLLSGVLLRFLLYAFGFSFSLSASSFPFHSPSPLHSFLRVREGLCLSDLGTQLFDGNQFHGNVAIAAIYWTIFHINQNAHSKYASELLGLHGSTNSNHNSNESLSPSTSSSLSDIRASLPFTVTWSSNSSSVLSLDCISSTDDLFVFFLLFTLLDVIIAVLLKRLTHRFLINRFLVFPLYSPARSPSPSRSPSPMPLIPATISAQAAAVGAAVAADSSVKSSSTHLIRRLLNARLPSLRSSTEMDSLYPGLLPRLPDMVLGVYLLNPFTVASSLSFSSLIFSHFFFVVLINFAVDGRLLLCAATLALLASIEVLNSVFLIPVALILTFPFRAIEAVVENPRKDKSELGPTSFPFKRSRFILIFFFLSTFFAIFFSLFTVYFFSFSASSSSLSSSLSSLSSAFDSTVMYSFFVSDLTPHVGLYWYFLAEMFDRFRSFFLFVLQSHYLVYVIPIALRCHRAPLLCLAVTFATSALFKPFPTLADMTFGFLLIFANVHLLLLAFRRLYLVLFLLLLSLLMIFIMFFVWLYPGSGNANFFYFQTLIFLFAQGFLIVECVGAFRRTVAAKNEEEHMRRLAEKENKNAKKDNTKEEEKKE